MDIGADIAIIEQMKFCKSEAILQLLNPHMYDCLRQRYPEIYYLSKYFPEFKGDWESFKKEIKEMSMELNCMDIVKFCS